MANQVPIFALIGKSGPLALFILLILAVLSVGVWAIIVLKALSNRKKQVFFKKWFSHLRAHRDFETIQQLYQEMPDTSLGRVSRAAIAEMEGLAPYVSFDSLEARAQLVAEAVERALNREININDRLLGFLALCSGVSPFLGLFGTVWGIMHSFLDIGNQGSANITVVAPGIAEALVTTIIGLSVAIPASAAYNFFVSYNRKTEAYLDDFGSELMSLFKRGDLKALEKANAAA